MIELLKNVRIDFKNIIKKFTNNQIVYSEDECLDSVGIILEGEIIITTSTINGFEFEITKLVKGSVFGDNLIFNNIAKLPGTIICKKDCKIMFIEKKEFIKSLENNHTFLENYLKYNAIRNIEHQHKIKLLGQPSIREKILFFLKEEMKRQQTNKITLPMNKENLAIYLGLNRPSLSRELIRMKNDGLIRYDKKTITYLK